MTIGYIASAKTGNGLSRLMLNPICRKHGIALLRYRVGLRKTESMGNRYIARIHPEIFVEKDKSDNDTETELYALEY